MAFSAMVRHEWRVQRRELAPVAMLTVMPVVLIAVLLPTYENALAQTGALTGNGAEHAVPGFAVMFALFLAAHAGMTFFRDHAWRTWLRVRTLPISGLTLVLAKLVVPFLLVLVQLTAVLAVGVALFELRVHGSPLALAVLLTEFAACVLALSVLAVALCQTVVQLAAATNVATLVITGLGGALVPVELLPDWLEPIAPLTPSYWAMRGFHSVIVDGAGLTGISTPLGVLGAMTLALSVIAAVLLRPDRPKEPW
ncbi:ABC transporter permease [Micromonospora sp. C95]|uniref:ABC transporter permease n=1 Tax=Micromonospora sp. C95 TaxID=2824882 RepID=UPI001B3706ED|nr:ABC transporter permease [Micromonospora sp. C95]MBQ1026021.1 ABC transporter permease [Micromonospora sp. C95]